MSFFPRLLNFGNFQNPLLRTIVPSVAAAVTLQAAVAIPSIAFQTERFYDVSGSLTYLAVGALSLYLPVLRAKAVTGEAKVPNLLGVFTGGAAGGVWNWRQVVLTGAVTLWAMRREPHKARLIIFKANRICSGILPLPAHFQRRQRLPF